MFEQKNDAFRSTFSLLALRGPYRDAHENMTHIEAEPKSAARLTSRARKGSWLLRLTHRTLRRAS